VSKRAGSSASGSPFSSDWNHQGGDAWSGVGGRQEENGVKWNVDKAGDWMLDAAGRRTAFTGGAGASDSGGFAYEYDDYYDYDHGDHEEL
jgi:hypothetical protein